MNKTENIIGCRVEYDAGGRTYIGRIIDKVRILGRDQDEGQAFDLYIVKLDSGRVYKVSPAAVKQILSNGTTEH
jgi:hypothetical protein